MLQLLHLSLSRLMRRLGCAHGSGGFFAPAGRCATGLSAVRLAAPKPFLKHAGQAHRNDGAASIALSIGSFS